MIEFREPLPWKIILRNKYVKLTYYGFDTEYLAFNENNFQYEIYETNPKKSFSWKSDQVSLF